MRKMMAVGLLTIPLLSTIFFPHSVSAVPVADEICQGGTANSAVCEVNKKNEGAIFGQNGVLTKVIQTLVYVAGVLSVIMVVVGALRITTSGGDPSAVKSGREAITYALIGLGVAIMGQAIVTFVLEKLGD